MSLDYGTLMARFFLQKYQKSHGVVNKNTAHFLKVIGVWSYIFDLGPIYCSDRAEVYF